MTLSANIASKLQRWMESRGTRTVGKRILGVMVTGVFVVIASHTVLALPWSDHQPEAQAIVRAAACVGVAKMLEGGEELQVMEAAVATAAFQGFGKAHGHEIWVIPTQIHHRSSGPAFSVKVGMTYQRPHFLIEDFTKNDSPRTVEVAVINEGNFDTCPRDQT